MNNISDIKGKHVQELMIWMKNFEGDHSVEVHFIGDTLDTGRYIKEQSLYSSGDVIKLNGKNRNTNYMVDITQTIFVEEDPNNNCRNYPNQDYHSYQECDEKYMSDLLPADLMPICGCQTTFQKYRLKSLMKMAQVMMH